MRSPIPVQILDELKLILGNRYYKMLLKIFTLCGIYQLLYI